MTQAEVVTLLRDGGVRLKGNNGQVYRMEPSDKPSFFELGMKERSDLADKLERGAVIWETK